MRPLLNTLTPTVFIFLLIAQQIFSCQIRVGLVYSTYSFNVSGLTPRVDLERGRCLAGGWLSGRALRSHRRGHWFESSTAHRLLRFRSHTDDFVRVSLPFFLPGKGYQVNNSPLRLQKTAEASLPLSDLQKYMDGWLLSCEISQHSAATLANQRLILKNLI